MTSQIALAGYLGLLAVMAHSLYKTVVHYRNTKYAGVFISIYFTLSILAGFAGFKWADMELQITLEKGLVERRKSYQLEELILAAQASRDRFVALLESQTILMLDTATIQ